MIELQIITQRQWFAEVQRHVRLGAGWQRARILADLNDMARRWQNRRC